MSLLILRLPSSKGTDMLQGTDTRLLYAKLLPHSSLMSCTTFYEQGDLQM